MKQRIELTVENRTTGKHFSRSLRKEKKIPAVIYGAMENANVFVNENDVLKYHTRAYENALFNLKSGDAKANGKVVLMKSVDIHPLSRRPVHVDFFALDLTKNVRLSVEVRLEGKPIGLAEGGLLNQVIRQVEIECLPTEIPEFFTIDVSHLTLGTSVHVSDLKISEKMKMLSAPELTLAVVNKAEDEVAAAATPAADAAAAAPAAGGKAAPGAKAAAAPKADDKKAAPAKDAKK